MANLLRNSAAVVLGLVIGSVVNMTIVMVGPMLIPPPAGVDVTNAESLAAGIHLFEPKHFLAPFLAHALGTLVGAVVAYLLAATHKPRFAWAIAGVFLCGGIAACFMIPAPAWFMALDLVGAYLPMGWLAIRLAQRGA
jgi:hypothetical protein